MDFEQLVRKYLRGSLSGEEQDRLRHLLESQPAYRRELRQILELRSVINDDALRLTPPADLSERTRVLVGTRFAGIEALLRNDAGALEPPRELADSTRDAVARMFAREERKVIPLPVAISDAGAPQHAEPAAARRRTVIPLRYAFSGLAAAVIATFVAVGPDLRQAFENPSGLLPITPRQTATAVSPERESSAMTAPEASPATGAAVAPATEPMPASAPAAARSLGSATRSPLPDGSAARRLSGGAADVAPSASANEPSRPSSLASGATSRVGDAAVPPARDAAALRPDAAGTLAAAEAASMPDDRTTVTSDLRPSEPTITDRSELPVRSTAVVLPASDDPFAAQSRRRLMAVGVTLGSGGVIEDNTPTPLMANAYYLSFSVGENDRIGVEMGGSTFMQSRQVAEQSGRGPLGKGRSADDDTVKSVRTGAVQSYTIVSHRLAEPITYGGVFYDRRLKIDHTWDLCGRVTFGAADGALIGGFRAYTAYTPSPNITLTAGVGGSTLFNLSRKTDRASLNYGIYYGIETGF